MQTIVIEVENSSCAVLRHVKSYPEKEQTRRRRERSLKRKDDSLGVGVFGEKRNNHAFARSRAGGDRISIIQTCRVFGN